MKPKLIILNGSLGVGKSTLATRYVDEHPLALRLDIDEIRLRISHWREEAEESARSSKEMAVEMARVHLRRGHDVIVPQIIRRLDLFENFEQVAQDIKADYYEVLLYVARDEAVHRFVERGKARGFPDGFYPGGLIDTGGRETKLQSMYDEMIQLSDQRSRTIRIEPELGNEEATYRELIKKTR